MVAGLVERVNLGFFVAVNRGSYAFFFRRCCFTRMTNYTNVKADMKTVKT